MAGAAKNWTHPVPVRFGKGDEALARTLRARANAHKRSLSEQIKYYAHLAVIAEDNPDLPLSFIRSVLEGQEEIRAGLGRPYRFGVIE